MVPKISKHNGHFKLSHAVFKYLQHCESMNFTFNIKKKRVFPSESITLENISVMYFNS